MTNVEQYINNDKHCFPPTINTEQGINIPKRCSRHLLVDKYLSEYKTEQEKKLVMQNILLMDSVPRENSTRLVNSGTVYKVMREGKLGRNQLTELFNYLQRTKADKSELFSKDYRELTNTPDFIQQQDLENYYNKNEIDNIIQNISLDNIDLSGYATQEYVQNQINNLIDGAPEALDTLKEITDKLSADGDIVNQILNQINEKANKSDVYTKIQLDSLLEIEQENISGKANNSDLQQTNELIQQLQNKIQQLESKQENIKHEILTQEMYDNLQQYDPYTVYFIVEQLPPTPVDPTPIDKNYWAFGDGFPVIFSKNKWRFGQRFPIIFSEGWTFGDEFPIILGSGQESQEEEPQIDNNGYEYVDLGLPSGTLWAKYNVGASSETEYGNYYMYGMGNKTYDSTDTPYEGTENLLNSLADTATQTMGGSWHTPTQAQMQELIDNTTYQWVINYKGSGINGGTFTATNGAVLFFPAAGYWSNDNQHDVDYTGEYWSSSSTGSTIAHCLYLIGVLGGGGDDVDNDRRMNGLSIRGVLDNNNQ